MLKDPFPIYRKYPNGLSFFKILSESEFIELKQETGTYKRYHFEAKIHPDRLFIQDMIANQNDHWRASTKAEYQEIAQQIID